MQGQCEAGAGGLLGQAGSLFYVSLLKLGSELAKLAGP